MNFACVIRQAYVQDVRSYGQGDSYNHCDLDHAPALAPGRVVAARSRRMGRTSSSQEKRSARRHFKRRAPQYLMTRNGGSRSHSGPMPIGLATRPRNGDPPSESCPRKTSLSMPITLSYERIAHPRGRIGGKGSVISSGYDSHTRFVGNASFVTHD